VSGFTCFIFTVHADIISDDLDSVMRFQKACGRRGDLNNKLGFQLNMLLIYMIYDELLQTLSIFELSNHSIYEIKLGPKA